MFAAIDTAFSTGILLASLLVSLGLFVAWVLTLINAAQTEQWVWFVLMLVFGPIVSILYFLISYRSTGDQEAARRRRQRRRRRARVAVEVHSR